jgi:hypothetical protein
MKVRLCGYFGFAICVGGLVVFAGAQTHPLFPVYPPTPDADPGLQHPVEVTVPARLSVRRTDGSLSVTYDPASLRNVTIMVGKKMTIGRKDSFRVYVEGGSRPPGGSLSLSEMKEQDIPTPIRDPNFLNSMETLTLVRDGIPVQGKRYVVEHEIVLFETDLPAQHFWSPEGGKKYRVLWDETLRAIQ